MWVQPESTRKLYICLWVTFITSCVMPYKLMGFMIGETHTKLICPSDMQPTLHSKGCKSLVHNFLANRQTNAFILRRNCFLCAGEGAAAGCRQASVIILVSAKQMVFLMFTFPNKRVMFSLLVGAIAHTSVFVQHSQMLQILDVSFFIRSGKKNVYQTVIRGERIGASLMFPIITPSAE